MEPSDNLDLFGDDVPNLPDASERLPDDHWPLKISELTDLVADELARSESLDARRVRPAACRVVARLLAEHGGAQWYVPKADALRRAIRDLEIWSRYDGSRRGPNGIEALSRRYRISEVAVWAILREQRALHLRSVQSDWIRDSQ